MLLAKPNRSVLGGKAGWTTNLDVAEHVRLDGGESNGAEGIYDSQVSIPCVPMYTERGFVPKMVVRDSAASRKSKVAMAFSLSASTGTSTKDLRKVWTMVWPAGMMGADMAAVV